MPIFQQEKMNAAITDVRVDPNSERNGDTRRAIMVVMRCAWLKVRVCSMLWQMLHPIGRFVSIRHVHEQLENGANAIDGGGRRHPRRRSGRRARIDE